MLILAAHAKVNLALEVTGRAGALHTIDSVMVRLDWHDLVGVSIDSHGARPRLHQSGNVETIPAGDDNLTVRGAQAALDAIGAGGAPRIWLHKRVPSSAGLGGGSGDAAAAMEAIATLTGNVSASPQLAIAARAVGSDVPAMVSRCAVRVRGTGEDFEALPTPRLDVVVVVAGACSTAAVYAAFADAEATSDGRAAALALRLRGGRPVDDDLLGSALEPAALRSHPAMARAAAEIRASWPSVRWHMTGSGGALFAVAASSSEARDLAGELAAAGFTARACQTVG
jgi:4-diphosphocytidyl-2-C-methyl-D-erythritol kinase